MAILFPPPAKFILPRPAIIRSVELPSKATFPFPVFAPVSGTRTPEYSYQTTVTDVTTVNANVNRTFTSVNIGAANPFRQVVVIFSSRTSTQTLTVNSVTIGGISATLITSPPLGNAGAQIFICQANVPTGTTANIVVNIPQTSLDGVIHVYRIVPHTVGTPLDFGAANSTSATTVTVADIAVITGGFLIVGAIDGLNPASLTPVYNGIDSPVNNYGAVVDSRTRLTWSAGTTETIGTNDPGCSKPSTSGFALNVVAASWN